MNKKFLMFGLPIIAIVLVSASLIVYYNLFTGTFNVAQAIETTGSETFSFDGEAYTAGESMVDCEYSVKNLANVEIPIKFGTTCNNSVG